MTLRSLPPDLRKLLTEPVDYDLLAAAWEANKRNQRKDSLTPERLAEMNYLLSKGTSVRETAKIMNLNRGRVWYVYKLMVKAKDISPQTGKKGKRGKNKVKAGDFI